MGTPYLLFVCEVTESKNKNGNGYQDRRMERVHQHIEHEVRRGFCGGSSGVKREWPAVHHRVAAPTFDTARASRVQEDSRRSQEEEPGLGGRRGRQVHLRRQQRRLHLLDLQRGARRNPETRADVLQRQHLLRDRPVQDKRGKRQPCRQRRRTPEKGQRLKSSDPILGTLTPTGGSSGGFRDFGDPHLHWRLLRCSRTTERGSWTFI